MRSQRCFKVRDGAARTASPFAPGPFSSKASTYGGDLGDAAVDRLRLVALLVAGFSIVIWVALPARGIAPAVAALRLIAFLGTCAVSLAVATLAWRRALPARRLLALAPAYQVVQALFFAVSFHAVSDPSGPPRGWSTVAVWVLAFPLVVPSTRARTAAATALAAFMDPLGLAIAAAAGAPLPPTDVARGIFLRTALAVVAAILVSRLLSRMSAAVVAAREMGAYRLLERIGRGGMGEVWRAEHRTLARPAAIKLVRPEALADNGWGREEAIARFEREARATAALQSPHTVAVYDFGTFDDGSLYYVMELLEGYDTDTLVRRFGPLPPARVVGLIRQACHSLEEAHRAGMVHRDIKPANILVCRYGLDLDFVKLVDFGLVSSFRGSPRVDERLTSPKAVAGTPDYMSPETALGRTDVDWRSDIYSLGCVAYWMLTGKPVFEADSPLKLAFAHAEEAPVPPSQRAGRVIPEGLERIVLDCLAKDPLERPQTAAALADRLAALGLEAAWTGRDAEIWWRDHPPARAASPPSDAPARLTRKTA